MPASVLTIVQKVAKRVGIPAPLIAVSSTDKQVIQLINLLEEVGQDLLTRFKWQELTARTTFTTVATEIQGKVTDLFGMPIDGIVSGTIWNDDDQSPLWGPMDDKSYQWQKSMSPAGPDYQYRIQGGNLHMLPVPEAGINISAIYRHKMWVVDATNAVFSDTINADGDKPLFDDHLMQLGLLARWKEEKGLPYAENARRFESMAVNKAIKSGTKPILYLDEPCQEAVPGIIVPAGSWPL